jgi:peroxiredoxin
MADRLRSKTSSASPQTPSQPIPQNHPDFSLPRQTGSYIAPAQAEPAPLSPGLPVQPTVIAPQTTSGPPPGQVQPAQPPAGSPASPYDFIMSSEKPVAVSRLSSLRSASLAIRAMFVAGGLFALLLVFIIFKSVFGGGSAFTPYIAVTQDQQELIHIATAANQQSQGISVANQNFMATAQLSLSSAQTMLITYLSANGQKIDNKTLVLKVSPSTDTQLQSALAATTYDQTLQQIMKNQLGTYMNDLQQAYKQTTGQKGHALLTSDYKQAQLLLTQLNEPGQ